MPVALKGPGGAFYTKSFYGIEQGTYCPPPFGGIAEKITFESASLG